MDKQVTTAKIEHNLTDEELVKALTALADESDIGEQLLKAVKARTCACDDTPKEPRYPAMRHLYRKMMQMDRDARKDIERYAREITSGHLTLQA